MTHATFTISDQAPKIISSNPAGYYTAAKYVPNVFVVDDITFIQVNENDGTRTHGNKVFQPDVRVGAYYSCMPRRNTVIRDFCDTSILEVFHHSKTAGTVIINQIGSRHCANFVPLEVYSHPLDFIPAADKRYLLRHQSGARGLCFMPVSSTGKSINAIDVAIKTSYEKHRDNQTALFDQLEKDGVGFTKEGLWPNETIVNTFFSSGLSNYDVIEYVPNEDIACEYRLMTDYLGEPVLIVPRKRLQTSLVFDESNPDDKLFMARGNDQDQYVAQPYDTKIIPEDVSNFFSNGYFPVMSFDLFIKKDGTWGFFELSTEFGFTSLPNGWVTDQSKRLIHNLYLSRMSK